MNPKKDLFTPTEATMFIWNGRISMYCFNDTSINGIRGVFTDNIEDIRMYTDNGNLISGYFTCPGMAWLLKNPGEWKETGSSHGFFVKILDDKNPVKFEKLDIMAME